MTDIEQFPVSKKDMERKLISQSARRLVKATGVKMKLSSSREVIANILGYRDCHDLQQQVANNCGPHNLVELERGSIYLLLMENTHKTLNVPLATALELLPKLGFHFYSALSKNRSFTAEMDLESNLLNAQKHNGNESNIEKGEKSKAFYSGRHPILVKFKPRRKIIIP